MVSKIKFKNYKPFRDWQELELKPITIIIGKNNAGKSAILGLPTMIENSLIGSFPEAILLENNGVVLGTEFADLIYRKHSVGFFELQIESENEKLEVAIGSDGPGSQQPIILDWRFKNEHGEIGRNMDDKYNGFTLADSPPSYLISEISLNTDYISALREPVKTNYPRPKASKFERVGYNGKDAYQLLIQDGLSSEKKLLGEVSRWYQDHFEGWGLRLNEDKNPFFQLELTRDDGRFNINVQNAGLGITQALPLVTRALMQSVAEMLIIIEEPELHLHPAVHGDIAQLFVDSVSSGTKKYLIETHSRNFVLRVRRLIAKGRIASSDVALYYVDFDKSEHVGKLKKINIDAEGEVDFWPGNIFNESLDEALAIRKAQREKHESNPEK